MTKAQVLPGFRRCKKCGDVKPLGDFPQYQPRTHPERREHRCVACRDRYHKRYYKAHRREIIAHVAEWKAENPDAVAASRLGAYGRRLKRDAAHARAVSARAGAARVARLRGAPEYEIIDRSAVFERDGGMCHICGDAVDPNDWHMDHIVPVVRGGTHTYDNVAVSHPLCNMRKGARIE